MVAFQYLLKNKLADNPCIYKKNYYLQSLGKFCTHVKILRKISLGISELYVSELNEVFKVITTIYLQPVLSMPNIFWESVDGLLINLLLIMYPNVFFLH